MDLNVNIPKPSIAVSFGGGRTANQLCNFASGYALWREFGILNYLDELEKPKEFEKPGELRQFEKLTKFGTRGESEKLEKFRKFAKLLELD